MLKEQIVNEYDLSIWCTLLGQTDNNNSSNNKKRQQIGVQFFGVYVTVEYTFSRCSFLFFPIAWVSGPFLRRDLHLHLRSADADDPRRDACRLCTCVLSVAVVVLQWCVWHSICVCLVMGSILISACLQQVDTFSIGVRALNPS